MLLDASANINIKWIIELRTYKSALTIFNLLNHRFNARDASEEELFYFEAFEAGYDGNND